MGITYTCSNVPVYASNQGDNYYDITVFRLKYITAKGIPNTSNYLMETTTPEAVQETDYPMETATHGAVRESEKPIETAMPSRTDKPWEVIPTIGVPTKIPNTIAPNRTYTPEITSSPIQTNPPLHTQLPLKTLPPTTLLPECTTTPVETEKPGSINTEGPIVTLKPDLSDKGYCQITYQLNGGKNHRNNPVKVKKKGVSVVLNAPSKAKYTFVGWYIDEKYTHKVTTVGNTSLSFLTLYAKWKKVTVKQVKFSMVKKKGRNSILVKVKKENGVKGFEYVYAKEPCFKRKCRLRTQKNPKTLSKLIKKKTYYIKVRAYKLDSTGKKIYGIYSRVEKVKL